jgi:3-oxoacyl-[acyl-carrier protein] reductase
MKRLTKLDRSIAGKVALVTGAGSGIGRATAQLFTDEGARVAAADVNADAVKGVVDEITQAGAEAIAFALDVSDPERIKSVVSETTARWGRLDILVNNAGVGGGAPIDVDGYDEVWAQTLAVNLQAHARLIRAALPWLEASGSGRVVNVASTEGLGATANISPYTASKHGVIGLTRGLAVELGSRGVTVNCVCPGPIHTGMTQLIPIEMKEKFARRRVPLRRYGDPEEVAHGILGLVLPASSYINAAVLTVDGGLTAQNT